VKRNGPVLFSALLAAGILASGATAAQNIGEPICFNSPAPVPPPDGGAVLRNGETVVVLPAHATLTPAVMRPECAHAASRPTSISVASPAFHNTTYAAIAFEGNGLTSAWGAVNGRGAVNANGEISPLELYPGRPDFEAARVQVFSGMDSTSDKGVDGFLRTYFSCRDCMLIRYGLGHSVDPSDPRGLIKPGGSKGNVAFVGDLSGANLYQASLHFDNPDDPTNPRAANLGNVNLSQANLSEVEGLAGGWMVGTNLGQANLIKTDLSDAQMGGANLQRAALIDADLAKANLAHADLSGANLNGANLTGANLFDANMSGTIMAHASDGQSLAAQSPSVQAAFKAAHGDKAEARWLAEHEAAVAGQRSSQ
jgi:hypothetical protein